MAKLLSGTRIYGNATVDTNLIVSGTTTSTSSGTGALTVAGGAGIVGNLTVGNILTVSAGIQNTPIGNGTASTGSFTTATASSSFNGPHNGTLGAAGGNTAIVTTLSATSNATVSGLTVNGTATIGTTLGVAGITRITDTTQGGSGTGALIVSGGGSFAKDLYVTGNVYTSNLIAINSSTLSVQDPLLYLTANTPYPYNYSIGFYSQYTGGNPGNTAGNTYQHTGFVRDNADLTWKLFSNVVAEPGATVNFTNAQWEPIKHGNLTVLGTLVANSTASIGGNATISALTVNGAATVGSTLGVTGNINGSGATLTGSMVTTGPAQHLGGLQATPIGNASASTGQFTTASATGNVTGAALTSNASITAITTLSALGGLQNTPIGNVTPSTSLFTTVGASSNATVAALTVNGSATVGTTLGVTGNITGGNLITGDNSIIYGGYTTLNNQGIFQEQGVGPRAIALNIGSGYGIGFRSAGGSTDQYVFSSNSISFVTGATLASKASPSFGAGSVTGAVIAANGAIIAQSAIVSTNSTSGAIIVTGAGGVGVGGNLNVGGNTTVGNLTTAGNVNSNSFFTGNRGIVAFNDGDSSNFVGFKAPNSVAVNVVWTLPSGDGASGYVLATDGLGTLSWAAGGGGGNTSTTGGYFNSTLTAFPGASANVDYGLGESYIGQSSTVDSFGISLVAVYSCNDPTGSIQSADLGSV